MPLPKSLTQPFRQGMLTIGSGWRAFFAPFNQEYAVSQTSTALGPSVYDLQAFGRFIDSAPPAGWADLGWIKKFKYTPASKIGAVRSGYRGAIRAQYRGEIGETLGFSFEEYSRLALSIASGTQVFNLIKTTANTSSGYPMSPSGTNNTTAIGLASPYAPSGATGIDAGYPLLTLSSGASGFAVGSMIVCDVDYDGTSFGYVGDSGANVFPGAVASNNVDFVRMTSDYVGTVRNVVGNTVVLTKPFVGGGNALNNSPTKVPASNAKVQPISGYVSREGGTYIREWSGVFILDTIDGSQILHYYPRISPASFAGLDTYTLENAGTTDLAGYELSCTLNALAYEDALDGETVTRYSAYYPKLGVDPY